MNENFSALWYANNTKNKAQEIIVFKKLYNYTVTIRIGECPSNSPFLKNNGDGMERYEDILQLKIHPLYFINCINY